MIVSSIQDIQFVEKELDKSIIVGYDTETTGLNVRKSKIIGFSIGTNINFQAYFPLYEWNLELKKLVELPFLTEKINVLNKLKGKQIICHNASFDIRITKSNFSIDLLPDLWCCTVLLGHTINENLSLHLKSLGVQFQKELGMDCGKLANEEQLEMHENIKKRGGSVTKSNYQLYIAEMSVIAKYCNKDVELTLRLYFYFLKILQKEGLRNFFFEDEVMPLYREFTIPAEERGIRLNIPLLEKTRDDIIGDIERLEDEIQDKLRPLTVQYQRELIHDKMPISNNGIFGNTIAEKYLNLPKKPVKSVLQKMPQSEARDFLLGNNEQLSLSFLSELEDIAKELYLKKTEQRHIINISSKDQLGEIFFNNLGYSPKSYTEKGKPQMNDDMLEEIGKTNRLGKLIGDFNKLNKIKGSYIDRFLEEQEDGIFYASYKQHGTTSGRFSSDIQQLPRPEDEKDTSLSPIVLKYNNIVREFFICREGYKFLDSDYCLHPDTELLTKEGNWKKILNITKEDEVWQVDPITLEGSWCKPKRIVKKEYNGIMYRFGNRRGFFDVTENHSMLFVGQFSNTTSNGKIKSNRHLRWKTKSQEGIPNTACNLLLCSDTDNTISNFSKNDLWISTMLSADGYIIKNRINYYKIEVSKERKVSKIKELLNKDCNIKATTLRGKQKHLTSTWFVKYNSELLDGKNLLVNKIGSNQIDDFVEALRFWDGSELKNGGFSWGSINKRLVEDVQAKLVSNGYEAKLRTVYYENSNFSTYYYLLVRKKGRVRMRKSDFTSYIYSGLVGCVTVDTGFILTRNNGQTFVTGNCSLEPMTFASNAGDQSLIDIFNKNYDMYSSVAISVYNLKDKYSADKDSPNFLKKHKPELRQMFKSLTLGIRYGLGAYKISKTLNIEIEEAQSIIENYFKAFPKLKDVMNQNRLDVLTKGFIQSEEGRIRHLPEAVSLYKKYGEEILDPLKVGVIIRRTGMSKEEVIGIRKKLSGYINNAYNFPIQSMAATIVNRASIAIAREFKKQGITGQVLVNVHDQLICEVSEKDLDKAKEIMQNCMENTVKLKGLDLIAIPEVCTNFREGH